MEPGRRWQRVENGGGVRWVQDRGVKKHKRQENRRDGRENSETLGFQRLGRSAGQGSQCISPFSKAFASPLIFHSTESLP